MASLVAALDSYTPLQLGENSHVEYSWSNNIEEKISQLYFQLVRTEDYSDLQKLSDVLFQILISIKNGKYEKEKRFEYLKIVFCILLHTRDLVDGKGEYTLSYMMLWTFYKVFPTIALNVLDKFVLSDSDNVHQLGSWKDMKYFAHFCHMNNNSTIDHPLIKKCIELTNTQLKRDLTSDNPSLCAKWIPRETSKYAWFFKELAKDWFNEYITTAKTTEAFNKAQKKSFMEYRKIISNINKKLDTVQIKQCGGKWASIDHNKTTSITLLKNKKAFLNINESGEPRSNNPDRLICAENFKEYFRNQKNKGKEMKGKRIGLEAFTKEAIEIFDYKKFSSFMFDELQYEMLNSQWNDNSKQTGKLDKMIAMVDVSGSMEGNPLYVAVALGIRVAEKSILGKRVMTFSNKPSWVNLDDCDNFIDMVGKIKNAVWGMNTNFIAALDLILDALVKKNVPPEDVDDMILAIFSDMQMDVGNPISKNNKYQTLFKEIEDKYQNAGYKVPHILFWNLRYTDGFPVLSSQKNTSMMSGYNASLLNMFCEKGIEALQGATAWDNILHLVTNEKYTKMIHFDESVIN